MIRQLRKEKGKRDQRRKYKEESCGPKWRKIQEGYEENRTLTVNTKCEKRVIPDADDIQVENKAKRKKKNQ
jgi:hypothetical protein